MATRRPVITLLTDFGGAEPYAAAMKGVIVSIQPEALVVDITHEVPPHDVPAAAFILHGCYRQFPRGTIHVAVVDPGVGGSRLPILLSTADYHFVGPDNGIFSYILAGEEMRGCHAITASHYMLSPVSSTFHGRDVFAPVAAYLARGVSPDSFGEPFDRPARFEIPRPQVLSAGRIRAAVLHVDRFGNVVLGLTAAELDQAAPPGGAGPRLRMAGGSVESSGLRETYEGAPEGKPFFLFGSTGYLEISANRASAAAMTGLKRGDFVEIEIG
jgi:S-adenosylmethionine hydrolase